VRASWWTSVDSSGRLAAQRERGRAAAKFDIEADRVRRTRSCASPDEVRRLRRHAARYYDRRHYRRGGRARRRERRRERRGGADRDAVLREGGGQAGDTGRSSRPTGVRVEDTQAAAEGLIVHRGTVVEGRIAVNDACAPPLTWTSAGRASATTRRRTCSRPRCGRSWDHMSNRRARLVAPDRLRFDFTHHRGDEPEELAAGPAAGEREDPRGHRRPLGGAAVRRGDRRRAMALFGEKYQATSAS